MIHARVGSDIARALSSIEQGIVKFVHTVIHIAAASVAAGVVFEATSTHIRRSRSRRTGASARARAYRASVREIARPNFLLTQIPI